MVAALPRAQNSAYRSFQNRAPRAERCVGLDLFLLSPCIFPYNVCMTTLLQEAIAKATQLDPAEQDALAQLILSEIESDKKWDAVLARSPEKMSKLAEKAWQEYEAGLTQPLDPDQL